MRGFFTIAFFLAGYLQCFARTNSYYVSPPPNGNDSNHGTGAEGFRVDIPTKF